MEETECTATTHVHRHVTEVIMAEISKGLALSTAPVGPSFANKCQFNWHDTSGTATF